MPTQSAVFVQTPEGQPNEVRIHSQNPMLLQRQTSFLFSKRFYGFVVAEFGVIGGMLTAWAHGATFNAEFAVTGILAVFGPLLALYGGIVANGPIGIEGSDTVIKKPS